jgi:amidase
MNTSKITVAQTNAFVATFEMPPTGSGLLDGLCFAVKDLIDVAGRKTGCGNPAWHDSHPPAVVHAVCVEQLLLAGARCVGKTVSDELAFSLLGQNHFYGTPLNPQAPDRVPGGSSSGSASAVACGLIDFALGTDTGGSTRVPASNCGIFGFRPSHGFISMAGVNPLAPTFDTVGVFSRSAEVLA